MEVLREAGLAGRVRVGAPLPLAGGTAPSILERSKTTNPGTEESFPPDDLLRPIERLGQGRLIEIVGEVSSGRTSLAYRVAAGATARGELVGWIDLPNSLDPRFLLRSGVNLKNVLWVRPPQVRAALRSAELMLKTGFALVTIDLEGAPRPEIDRLGTPIWSRLLRAVRESRTTAIVLGPTLAAGASSTLGLHTRRARAIFDEGLFEGLEAETTVLRNRTGPDGQSVPFQIRHRPESRVACS
ncbi:MAG: hypothetical protein GY725_12220 [bacterium]|nr:hypothetical protein [bacterium]